MSGEKLLLPLPKAACWDLPHKRARTIIVLLENARHCGAFLLCDVMEEVTGVKKN